MKYIYIISTIFFPFMLYAQPQSDRVVVQYFTFFIYMAIYGIYRLLVPISHKRLTVSRIENKIKRAYQVTIFWSISQVIINIGWLIIALDKVWAIINFVVLFPFCYYNFINALREKNNGRESYFPFRNVLLCTLLMEIIMSINNSYIAYINDGISTQTTVGTINYTGPGFVILIMLLLNWSAYVYVKKYIKLKPRNNIQDIM